MAAGGHVIDKAGLTGEYDFTLEYDLQRSMAWQLPVLSMTILA